MNQRLTICIYTRYGGEVPLWMPFARQLPSTFVDSELWYSFYLLLLVFVLLLFLIFSDLYSLSSSFSSFVGLVEDNSSSHRC